VSSRFIASLFAFCAIIAQFFLRLFFLNSFRKFASIPSLHRPDGLLDKSNFLIGQPILGIQLRIPAGAQSNAVIYSLIETAKERSLDPYRYLLWVLKSAPALAQTDETWAEKLIPACAPDMCKPSRIMMNAPGARENTCTRGVVYTPVDFTLTRRPII
jgi:hypothetical protein